MQPQPMPRMPQPMQPAPQTPPQQPYPYPPRHPNDLSRGFTIAGIILAVIAAICALIPLWDKVSVFGVVGLAMTAIAACSMFTDRGRTPVWVGTIVVAALLCIGAIIVTAVF